MSKEIRIKKGLDIRLIGEAERTTTELPVSGVYQIKPDHFHGIIPKMTVKVGAKVKAGQSLFFSKANPRMLFPSPVSGKIGEIVRGERRKVSAIQIHANATQEYLDFGKKEAAELSSEEIREHLLSSGCWPFIKQRPYDVIANPDQKPKAIFISGYASTPLAPDYDYVLKGKEAELQEAITALGKLTDGKIHVSISKKSKLSPFSKIEGVAISTLSGPHPVGNVSTQIAHLDPLNKGEVVWVVSPQDLVVIGTLFLTGRFHAKRTVALTGARFSKPAYVTTYLGATLKNMVRDTLEAENTRIISGDVLSGEQVSLEGALGYYDQQITAIPEGDDYEFFGWNKPVFNKISTTRALTFSWLYPKKKYDLNTNTNGEHRAFVVTGSYEAVFPLDMYPLPLLKACLYKDLDEMEALGAYEIAPEDFALTEFVCVSKQPHQQIIRKGLDLMLEELG